MYTRCANCNTVFAITATQLRVGRGRVRCGTCLEEFDGLATLSEGLPSASASASPSATPGDAPAPAGPPAGAPGDPLADTVDLDGLDEDEVEAVLSGAAASEISLPGRVPAPSVPTLAAASKANADATDEVPEVLREDLARLEVARRGRWQTAGWGAAAAFLLAVLVAQYAWFHPAELVGSYPQAHALVARFCAATGCALPDPRRPDRVRVVARDVRLHPRYEGAVLVSATLVNAAAAMQPFPRLQFTLFNVNGQVIASRVFAPSEYLGGAADPDAGMRPEQPVQIALEMIAPEQVAVSFEFRFL